MNRDLSAAEALLRDAINRWPQASANIHGHRTPSSAGLLDGGNMGGYPTGHTGSARLECDCATKGNPRTCRNCNRVGDPTGDAARHALRTIDNNLAAIITLCHELRENRP